MEDEFTRRIDNRIAEEEADAKNFLSMRDTANYHVALGRIQGLNYSKQIYIAMKTRYTTNTIAS